LTNDLARLVFKRKSDLMHDEILKDMSKNAKMYIENVRVSLGMITGIEGDYQKLLEVLSWF